MQYRFTRMLAGMRRGIEFLEEYKEKLTRVYTGGAFVALKGSVDALSALAVSQTAHQLGRSGGVRNEKKLSRLLRVRHIAPVVRVARMRVPEVAALEAVRMPAVRSNGSETAQLALSMADAVEPYFDALRVAGLGDTFLIDLRAAADAVLKAISVKEEHRWKSAGATQAIREAVDQARKVVAGVDALVVAEAGEEQPLSGQWRSIVREIRAEFKATNGSASAEVDSAVVAPQPEGMPKAA